MSNPNGATRQQPIGKLDRVIPFGKYLLLERVAVGGMAEVFMAKSFGVEGFEKVLAIKRILPTMAEDDEFIEMFIDEAKIAGQLNHANIAPIFELGKIGDSHYIAMEYVWGKDLLQIMNRHRRLRKRMDPTMVAWVAARMCEALDYAHTKRDRHGVPLDIIHRDVSPQNILCSYEGEVKLIDFGIAKAASRTTRTQAGVLKGKFGYMSPEQVRGLPIDVRSDIFAVGTCMYEMLTSDRLFMGESDFSTLEKVRNAAVPPISSVVEEVTGELNDIVMKALQRDVVDRWQSAAELQEALQTFLVAQRPPFGANKLSSWLKTAFAPEMAKEKERMDAFSQMGRPAPMVAAARDDDAEDIDDELTIDQSAMRDDAEVNVESTIVSPSPFEANEGQWRAAAGVPVDEEFLDQPTQIFFSSEQGVQDAPAASPLEAFEPQDFHDLAPDYEIGELEGQHPAPEAALGGDLENAVSSSPLGVVEGVAPEALEPESRKTTTGSWRWVVAASGISVVMAALGVAIAYNLFSGEALGNLKVRTEPDVGATVKIDAVPRGTAPVEVRLRPGEHVIEVVAGGYESAFKRVTVEAGSQSSYEVLMTPLEESADAPVPLVPSRRSLAEEASEVLGRELLGSTAADPEIEIPRSSAPAEERAPNRPTAMSERPERTSTDSRERRRDDPRSAGPEPRPVSNQPERPTSMRHETTPRGSASPTPAPRMTTANQIGSISVNSIPYSRVFVDGRDTGRDTPAMSIRVPAGQHQVLLRTADGRTHARQVEVVAGENVSVVHQFR